MSNLALIEKLVVTQSWVRMRMGYGNDVRMTSSSAWRPGMLTNDVTRHIAV